MLAALIIVFREVFEAGLIVGIVMAVTRAVAHRGWWISAGVLGGVLGACVVAIFAGTLSATFGGSGQELFNASILGIAVVMLTWHNVWMAQHGRELASKVRAVGEACYRIRSLAALAIVVGVAVLREGVEVVLFLYGIGLRGRLWYRSLGWRRDRADPRRSRMCSHLFRPALNSKSISVHRNKYDDCPAGGWHGRTGCLFPATSQCGDDPRHDSLGHLLDFD